MVFFSDFAFILVALFALGFTIFIHELGHFLAARQRGLIITRFSIGFGPKLFGWVKDGVEYRISMFPFGGYVALPQLADMGRLEGENENSDNPRLAALKEDIDDDEKDGDKEDGKNLSNILSHFILKNKQTGDLCCLCRKSLIN